MAQWINLNRNNSFINWTRLPLLCEKSGVILLVLVGLTAGRLASGQAGGWVGGRAGRQAGRQTDRQTDQILSGSKIFKII